MTRTSHARYPCTSRHLTATAAKCQRVRARPTAPPLPSALEPHRPGLAHRPAWEAAPGRAYKPSGALGSAFTPAHPPDSGSRGAFRLPGLQAPPGPDLGHHRSLSLPTHTPATLPRQAEDHTYLRVQVVLACVGRCVLRCPGDQNGRCSPGHSEAARFPPITACYTPPLHFSHTHNTHTHQTLRSVFPPPRSPRGGSPRKSKQCGREGAEEEGTEIAGAGVPSSRSHTSVCCVWQTPGVHISVCSEMS